MISFPEDPLPSDQQQRLFDAVDLLTTTTRSPLPSPTLLPSPRLRIHPCTAPRACVWVVATNRMRLVGHYGAFDGRTLYHQATAGARCSWLSLARLSPRAAARPDMVAAVLSPRTTNSKTRRQRGGQAAKSNRESPNVVDGANDTREQRHKQTSCRRNVATDAGLIGDCSSSSHGNITADE